MPNYGKIHVGHFCAYRLLMIAKCVLNTCKLSLESSINHLKSNAYMKTKAFCCGVDANKHPAMFYAL